MQTPRALCVVLAIGVVLAAGCQSSKNSRAKPRYRTVENSFTDQAARGEYIERRVKELTGKGVNPEDANARASREWFAQAPTSTQVATEHELKRRAAEADIRSYLDGQKENGR